MKSSSSKSAGYTLLEMLVVLAIMATIMAAFGAGFQRLDQRGASARDASRVASMARAARAQALSQNKFVELRIEPANGHIYIEGMRNSVELDQTTEIIFTGGREISDANSGIGVIRFYADGSASGGEIRLIAEHESNTIAIDWLTGKVSVGRERAP